MLETVFSPLKLTYSFSLFKFHSQSLIKNPLV